MLGLDRHPVRRLLDRQRRMAGQQIDHHACMRRIEMLDQDKGHAGAAREDREQPAERIEAARRGAEPDDRETVMPRAAGHAFATAAGSPAGEPLRSVADPALS